MQTTTYSLSTLLGRVRDKSLTIPRFQRKFFWRESDVRSLIDSISRSYPIGSLLRLDKKPDLRLATRDIQAMIREEDLPNIPPHSDDGQHTELESYILDGQQRTTSIVRVFLNAHKTKVYYFDLKDILEHHDDEATSWIRTRYRRKGNNPDRRDNNRLLRADLCLNQKKSDIYVSEYIEDSGDFPEYESNRQASREASAKIKGIFEKIRNYKVPVVSLDPDHGLESICRVFETINSTGTRLSTFDLAVARFYPNPDVRQLWEDTIEHHRILGEFSKNKDDGEQVLQIICLKNSKGSPGTSRGALLGIPSETIASEWQEAANALANSYGWAKSHGARPEALPNRNVLAAMAAVQHLRNSQHLNNDWLNQEFFRRWYYSKVLQAGASQASNYRIGQNYKALRDYATNGNRPAVEDVKLTSEMVQGLKPQDVRYKSLQCIFSYTSRYDLISGAQITPESKLHDHHIFPKSLLKRYDNLDQEKVDSLCNRLYILDKSNLKVSDSLPESYLKDLADRACREGTLAAFQRRLADCMIPGDPVETSWESIFSVDRFDEFCQARADLIMARVSEVIGDSLKETALSEDEIADVDD